MAEKAYLAIDLKTFYASAECADRDLDPLTTNLVVADESKTEKTICLAVSPSLKALGLGGRCRLFEVEQKVAAANETRKMKAPKRQFTSESYSTIELNENPAAKISYITAKPRMAYYLEVSAKIYAIYLRHVAPEDIFSYSIDEVFMDISGYLKTNKMSAKEFAKMMVLEVQEETGITATCGIGTNMYLAKIAMDIMGKKISADKDGVRIAELDEYTYRAQLWDHKPITDFWRVGKGTAKKLEKKYIYTMGDLARESINNQAELYKMFGVDAEILIDHAWGVEPCTMEDVQRYEPENESICDGQVLSEPYPYEKARIIVREMADNVMYQLMEHEAVTDLITMDISYDRENCDKKVYSGKTKTDGYGRKVPLPAHGSMRLTSPTNLGSQITEAALGLFDRIADKGLTVRRITITAEDITKDEGIVPQDLFTDTKEAEEEKAKQEAIFKIKKKYGKNAILKGTDFQEGATARSRNEQIGGHKA